MGPTWGPPGTVRTQVGPMLVPWTLLSRIAFTKLTLAWWAGRNKSFTAWPSTMSNCGGWPCAMKPECMTLFMNSSIWIILLGMNMIELRSQAAEKNKQICLQRKKAASPLGQWLQRIPYIHHPQKGWGHLLNWELHGKQVSNKFKVRYLANQMS